MNMTDFREMPYTRPDIKAFRERKQAAAAALRGAKSYAEARKIYFDLQQAEEEADTLFSLAYVRNTIDTRDEFYGGGQMAAGGNGPDDSCGEGIHGGPGHLPLPEGF